MPTYSYRCTECGNAFDISQAFTDESLTVCPNCGGKLRKLFSAVGVSFSGSGFYRNDSRASENKAREKAEKPAAATTTSTDSKTPATSAPASSPTTSAPAAKASTPTKTSAPKSKE